MDKMVAAGAVPLLAALLRANQPAVQLQATFALGRLACGSQQNMDIMISAGAVSPHAAMLGSNQATMQEAAVYAVCPLAEGSQQNCGVIIATGAVPLLAALMRSDETAIQKLAACTLWMLERALKHIWMPSLQPSVLCPQSPPCCDEMRSHLCKTQQQAFCAAWQLALKRARTPSSQQMQCLCLFP